MKVIFASCNQLESDHHILGIPPSVYLPLPIYNPLFPPTLLPTFSPSAFVGFSNSFLIYIFPGFSYLPFCDSETLDELTTLTTTDTRPGNLAQLSFTCVRGSYIFVYALFFLGQFWMAIFFSDEFSVLSCMSWRSHGKFCVNGVKCMTIPLSIIWFSFIFGRGPRCD